MSISYTETILSITVSTNYSITRKKFRTFKNLESQIQGFSRTNPVFKYSQGLEFREKIPGI